MEKSKISRRKFLGTLAVSGGVIQAALGQPPLTAKPSPKPRAMTAMTAARLGETRLVVDALLMSTEKNRYRPNGHNWQRQNLPCYLPGNGGLLYAIAMMSAGWQCAPGTHAPGFPADGSWKVRWEKLNASILRNL